MKIFRIFALGVLVFPLLRSQCWADFSQELQDQINDLESKYASMIPHDYFHDMGIVARKADDAGLNDLTTQIVRTYLLQKMEDHVNEELRQIEKQLEVDRYTAANRIQALKELGKYYKPSQDFLRTAGGLVISQELARHRQSALEGIRKSVSEDTVKQTLLAIKKTDLFLTNRSEEITQMRELLQELDCGLAWKSQINYRYTYDFKTDYEEGTVTEEAHLKLQTDQRSASEARWAGEWSYRFKGREGEGQGLSHAVLDYPRGSDYAGLKISTAKLNSSGRIFMPIHAAGEDRQVEKEGTYFFPCVRFSGTTNIPLLGCKENKLENG